MVLIKKVLYFYALLLCCVLRVTAMEQNQQIVTQVTNYSAAVEEQGYTNTQTINTGYPVFSLVTAPEHNKVACTVLNKTQGVVQLYSFTNNDDTKEIEPMHAECVGTGDGGLAYCNNALYSANLKGLLKTWDVQKGTVTSTFQLQDPCAVFVVTPEKMVTGNFDGGVTAYQTSSHQLQGQLSHKSYCAPITNLLCLKNFIIANSSYCYLNHFYTFDLDAQKVVTSVALKEAKEVSGLCSLSPSMFLVAVNGSLQNYIYCYDYRFADYTNAVKWESKKLITAASSITSFSFVSGHDDGEINLWDLRCAKEPLQKMKDYTAKVQALAVLNEKSFFSASGSVLKLHQLK